MTTETGTPDRRRQNEGDDTALEHFYAELGRLHLEGLWRINQTIMPFEPKPRAKPWLWRFEDLARLAHQAGKLVPIDRGGDRRVLACLNPGLVDGYGGSVYGATATLWAAVQYLDAHEFAPGHRHSPSALRFVVEGSGAWTTVDGDRCDMAPGDLVLTPSYAWHEATRTALEGLRDNPDPWDGVLLRYTNPATGGPVLPTLEAAIQLLPAGGRTAAHRHVHSTVYQVFRGRGETVVDGTRFRWERGDIVAVPPWAVHDHRAVDGEAILFSITDAPVVEKLGLERVLGVDGEQDVTAEFDAP